MTPETFLAKYSQGSRDFSGVNLNESILIGAQLPHIILRQASLNVVNLSSANLSHSDLSQASLNVSRLSGANLSQAKLQETQLNVSNLIRAVLVGADFSDASLIRAELVRADLSNATLVRANLNEADLREARLRWTRLSGANLSQCDLRKSSLLGADLEAAQLNSAQLGGASLPGANLQGAEMRHVNLVRADLGGANLRRANLRWADLSNANLQDADLTDAKLSGAKIIGARMEGAILANTTLVHADMTQTDLRRAYCVGSDLSGATLTGVCLYEADCYDLKTQETSCEWIDLSPTRDRSRIQKFTQAAAIHAFFNRRPPQVRIAIDAALTMADYTALAQVYQALSQVVPWFNRPPNIEVWHYRTVLTLIADRDYDLMAIAHLAVWPFQDAGAVQAAIAELQQATLPEITTNPALATHHESLFEAWQAVRQALDVADLSDCQAALLGSDRWTTPTQVSLVNAKGERLDVYHNAHFGLREEARAGGLFPVQAPAQASPRLEDYRAFLLKCESFTAAD